MVILEASFDKTILPRTNCEQLGGSQLLESVQANCKSKRSRTLKGFSQETVLLAKKMLREICPLGGAPRMIMKYRRWRGGEMGE